MRLAVLLFVGLCSSLIVAPVQAQLPFYLKVDGLRVAHEHLALYALPGKTVTLGFDGDANNYRVEYPVGNSSVRNGVISLVAPASPGMAAATVTHRETETTMHVALFTMVSADEVIANKIDGYRIGTYPSTPLRGNPVYLPPAGFVRMTEANAATQISPNFSLGEFACKQTTTFPKYVVMNPALTIKLERILEELRAAGHAVTKFTIMSGYRTPYYNEAIGNVRYSRHLYGDAADVYVDENPRDDVMDDLNEDGRSNVEDARWLVAFIDKLERSGKLNGLVGGLSAYGTTTAHGPFVHIDTRGSLVRW